MSQTKQERRDEQITLLRTQDASILAGENLRSTTILDPGSASPAKGEDRLTLFWRIFGGTVLSIVALTVMTAYQQLNNNLHELRSQVNNLNESRVELVKKDELNSRLTSSWNVIREMQTAHSVVPALKERSDLLEKQLKAAEDERKELTRELQRLKERLATLEGRQGIVNPERVHGGVQ